MKPNPTHEIINEALRITTEAADILAGSRWVNCNPYTLPSLSPINKPNHCSITPFKKPIACSRLDRARIANFVMCVFLHEANKLTKTTHYAIQLWNDQPDRMREEVEEVYRRTIERLRNAVPMGE